MVELNEFIAAALTSIVRGISQAQGGEFGDHMAPLIQGEGRNAHGNYHLKDDPSSQATIVQFDVQVTTDRQTEAGARAQGKFRLFVVEATAGADGKVASKTSDVHRLQFAVPIKLPRRAQLKGGPL